MRRVEYPILDRLNLELYDYVINVFYYPETTTYQVECITIGDSFVLMQHYNEKVIVNFLHDLYQIILDSKASWLQ